MRIPCSFTEHAVERLRERHLKASDPSVSYGEARDVLIDLIACSRYVAGTWNPNDLDGLGQSIWCDHGTGIRLVVDGSGTVRTVLP